MIDRAALLADLKEQVAALEADLRERMVDGDVQRRLREDWERARKDEGTAVTFPGWRDERITQAAVAWVLATVFVRFCEDNGLIEEPCLAGPGDRLARARGREAEFFRRKPLGSARDWLVARFREISQSPVVDRLFHQAMAPMRRMEISHHAASRLLAFWRRDVDGVLVHDFADPTWDTSFLGDLYQELSEHARNSYALVQTPRFVAEFIVDQTLKPLADEQGPDELRVADPVCGSGTFLLIAFDRLFAGWRSIEPDAAAMDLIHRSLESIYGVDKVPFAVAIARFRLMIAALREGGCRRLVDAPDLPINVAVGDSLLDGRKKPDRLPARAGDGDDLARPGGNTSSWNGPLRTGGYHVVVGNPPYSTVKDKAEREVYRSAYPVCIGNYSLTVPFAQRFFELAKPGDRRGTGAGYVGYLAANSFMKREFGRRLIEDFFPTVELTQVIDASGVYIPGHGTPTVLLFGRSRSSSHGHKAVAVTCKKGEPHMPAQPERGQVWQSLLGCVAGLHRDDEWAQSFELSQEMLHTFPWSLANPTTTTILRAMASGPPLHNRVARIGYFASTGADDIFVAPPATFRRIDAERSPLLGVITGSEVRDWTAVPDREAVFLPSQSGAEPQAFPRQLKRLWPYRTVLGERTNYTGRSFFKDKRLWYEWHHVTRSRRIHPWSIVFAWVATHPHFALLRPGVAPLNSAPVIELPDYVLDVDLIQLTALLNSSTVGFWLKQHSQSKGQPRADLSGGGEPWTTFYQFTSTRLGELPLPPDRWSTDRWSIHAGRLDGLARETMALSPTSIIAANGAPSRAELEQARASWTAARAKMIAVQEELDWEIYGRYGLAAEAEDLLADAESTPGLQVGERAFEIVLARKLAASEIDTSWFTRHHATRLSEPPVHWPASYRRTVLRRIEAIEADGLVAAIERPEYKRRWAGHTWDELEAKAIHEWLLDQCERPELWYENSSVGKPMARPLTVAQLAELLRTDPRVREAADLYAPGIELAEVLRGLVTDQHVPYLAALRMREPGLRKRVLWEETWQLQRLQDRGYLVDIPAPPKYTSGDFLHPNYWRLRGKHDVPNERFITYPNAAGSGGLLVGWAGWDHREQTQVLLTLIEELESRDSRAGEQLIPLLAGLAELIPWLSQWHGRATSTPEGSQIDFFAAYLEAKQAKHGISSGDLMKWRPEKPRRGRPRKNV